MTTIGAGSENDKTSATGRVAAATQRGPSTGTPLKKLWSLLAKEATGSGDEPEPPRRKEKKETGGGMFWITGAALMRVARQAARIVKLRNGEDNKLARLLEARLRRQLEEVRQENESLRAQMALQLLRRLFRKTGRSFGHAASNAATIRAQAYEQAATPQNTLDSMNPYWEPDAHLTGLEGEDYNKQPPQDCPLQL